MLASLMFEYCAIDNFIDSTIINSIIISSKRFLEQTTLDKRFFEILQDNSGAFMIELLKKRYIIHLSQYVWHNYESIKQYAFALIGLSGCTAVFITSLKGMFSAHIWEEDVNINEDLQPANYVATTEELKSRIAPHKVDFTSGDA